MWQRRKIGDLINLKRGYDLPSSDRINGDIPIISSSGVTDYHNEFKKCGEGVVTGRYGTLGEVFYINGMYWPLNTTLYVTDFKGNCPKFIYYFLKTLKLERFNGAAAVPGLDRNVIHKVEVLFPNDFSTQQKIASILSAYDELIENNKQRIKLLEEMAEEIYKEWFVRLRFPNYENTEFVDGLPMGWENGSIGSLYNVKSGFAFKSEDFGEIGYPIIKIRNIDNLEVDTINCDRYSGEINDRIKKFEIQNGDLLVAMTGATIGKVALFYTQNEPYYLNQRVGKFFNKPKVTFNQAFIYQFTKTDDFKSSVNNFALGAAQPNISGEQIENIKLLIPDSEVLASFSKLVGIMIDEIFILKSKNQLLQQTRDLLLPRLISGKLSVEGLAEAKEYVLGQNAEQWPMAAEAEGEYHH